MGILFGILGVLTVLIVIPSLAYLVIVIGGKKFSVGQGWLKVVLIAIFLALVFLFWNELKEPFTSWLAHSDAGEALGLEEDPIMKWLWVIPTLLVVAFLLVRARQSAFVNTAISGAVILLFLLLGAIIIVNIYSDISGPPTAGISSNPALGGVGQAAILAAQGRAYVSPTLLDTDAYLEKRIGQFKPVEIKDGQTIGPITNYRNTCLWWDKSGGQGRLQVLSRPNFDGTPVPAIMDAGGLAVKKWGHDGAAWQVFLQATGGSVRIELSRRSGGQSCS